MARRWLLLVFSLVIVVLGAAFTRYNAASAPPGHDRYTFMTVNYTAYEWVLATWEDQVPLCNIIIDHEGIPFAGEIYRDCGETVYENWIDPDVQKPCMNTNKHLCSGYYVHALKSYSAQKEIPAELPPATVWVSLEGCQPVLSAPTNICETSPTLVITGEEPLPGHTIIRIEGTYDGRSFNCNDPVCKFEIPGTVEEGVTVEFWAFSSYGDSSLVYSALVRVQQADTGDPDSHSWYADVLSSQWRGHAVATCSDSWGAFPPVGGPPVWLSTPKLSEELSSDIPYTYLAANLIKQGIVDASACIDGGLNPDGTVNQCGLEQARPAVTAWQNQFDELILTTAKETAVPARLLKNLFARESQFWPGVYEGMDDFGLGQLTENGADTTLYWNSYFYEQFCPFVLSSDACGNGYIHITEEERGELRRALVRRVNATCAECPLGINLEQAGFSVTVFAHTMIANCEQTGQVIENYAGDAPGAVASFEDLWKFTLVNYNAGGGCLAEAVSYPIGLGQPLTWENVSPYLTGACGAAVDYVNDISQ
ncbi:MAG: hypothetical protein HYZ23_10040 [Chloroflexi bacterium]|nr:hypothetical protein [Chloroflexota bacterium]